MIMLTPLPGAWPLKPGCATLPFFGVEPVLLDDKGKELKGPAEGLLALRHAWPAMMRTLLGDQQRFEDTYFGPMKVCGGVACGGIGAAFAGQCLRGEWRGIVRGVSCARGHVQGLACCTGCRQLAG